MFLPLSILAKYRLALILHPGQPPMSKASNAPRIGLTQPHHLQLRSLGSSFCARNYWNVWLNRLCVRVLRYLAGSAACYYVYSHQDSSWSLGSVDGLGRLCLLFKKLGIGAVCRGPVGIKEGVKSAWSHIYE